MLTSFFSLPSFFFSLSLFSPCIQNFYTRTPTLMSFRCPCCCLSLPLSCLLMYASSCYFIFLVPGSEAHLPTGQFFCKLATLKICRMSYYLTAVCIDNYIWTTFHRRKLKKHDFSQASSGIRRSTLFLWFLRTRTLITNVSFTEMHTYE